VAEEETNESAVVELPKGELVMKMRSCHAKSRRAVQLSRDVGRTWGPLTFDETFIEPVCQASMMRAGNTVYISNPAAAARAPDPPPQSRRRPHLERVGGAVARPLTVFIAPRAALRPNRHSLQASDRGAYERIVFSVLRF
jgi:hypothetical protein